MEMYCRTYLTENEHFIVHDQIAEYAKKNNVVLQYYRKMKNGHRPMWREFKVSGDRGSLLKLAEEFKTAIDNRWRTDKRAMW